MNEPKLVQNLYDDDDEEEEEEEEDVHNHIHHRQVIIMGRGRGYLFSIHYLSCFYILLLVCMTLHFTLHWLALKWNKGACLVLYSLDQTDLHRKT